MASGLPMRAGVWWWAGEGPMQAESIPADHKPSPARTPRAALRRLRIATVLLVLSGLASSTWMVIHWFEQRQQLVLAGQAATLAGGIEVAERGVLWLGAAALDQIEAHPGGLLESLALINRQPLSNDAALAARERLVSAIEAEQGLLRAIDVRQTNLIDCVGRAIYRFHQPDVWGDDLSGKRPGIGRLIEYGAGGHGFELGRFFHGYRLIRPLRDGQELVGGLEIGFSLGRVLTPWLDQLSEEGIRDIGRLLLLPRDTTDAVMMADARWRLRELPGNPEWYEERYALGEENPTTDCLRQALTQDVVQLGSLIQLRPARVGSRMVEPVLSRFDFSCGINQLHLLQVYNLDGQAEALLALMVPDREHAAVQQRERVVLAGVAVLWLLLGMVLYDYGRRRVQRLTETERLTLLMDRYGDAALLLDRDSTVLHANELAHRLFDFPPGGLRGVNVHQSLHPHRSGEPCPVLQAALRGEGFQHDEFSLRRRDGSALTARIHLLPASSRTGEQLMLVHDRSAEVAARERMERERSQFVEDARHDSLTGLFNRGEFDARLALEWQRALRNQQPLAVLMLDVDFFKSYNDHAGHLAGDDALRKVAAVLLAQFQRGTDLIARYGGEEFVALLPETSLEEAWQLAERTRAAVEAMALPHPGRLLAVVTISVGVASQVPHRLDAPYNLVERADRALYRAKDRGRNRVEGRSEGLLDE